MPHATASTDVHGLSRVAHAIDSATSRAGAAAAVLLVVVAFLTAIAIAGFSSNLQFEFATFAGAVTLVMVFVIQHTQNRQLLALQIKLDELLRALPEADDRFVHVERGSDDELEELETRHVERHAALRDPDDTQPPDPAAGRSAATSTSTPTPQQHEALHDAWPERSL